MLVSPKCYHCWNYSLLLYIQSWNVFWGGEQLSLKMKLFLHPYLVKKGFLGQILLSPWSPVTYFSRIGYDFSVQKFSRAALLLSYLLNSAKLGGVNVTENCHCWLTDSGYSNCFCKFHPRKNLIVLSKISRVDDDNYQHSSYCLWQLWKKIFENIYIWISAGR